MTQFSFNNRPIECNPLPAARPWHDAQREDPDACGAYPPASLPDYAPPDSCLQFFHV
jgi:hypothetical protein